MAVDAPAHPVQLVVTDDLRRSRITVFFRGLFVLPHIVWLGLLGIGMVFAVPINWVATLIRGEAPGGLDDFLTGYLRYRTHVYAYLLLASNPFPAFYIGAKLAEYPVDLQLPGPKPQNRWVTAFRFFLALPAILLAAVLVGGTIQAFFFFVYALTALTAILMWPVSLIRGRAPQGLRDLTLWAIGYRSQTISYFWVLTDRYPNLSPTRILAGLPVPDAAGRARLVNSDNLRRPRLTVFFRLMLAFPHLFWLYLWLILALFASIANWFFTLAAGRAAGPLARFLTRFVRYQVHVSSFLYGMGGPFPGFVGKEGTYPVDVEIPTADRQKRLVTLFRFVLVLPAAFLSYALSYFLGLVAIFGWFASLVLGRMPAGIQEVGAYVIGYTAQLNCYVFSLTDRYPHSSPLAVLSTR
ncbi:MAG TPA: DUF4389 domain-containing protein [Gaiellaceae bacterium]|nr:DUF4389 domain-containing protein [Gaiellaceae bacterium]